MGNPSELSKKNEIEIKYLKDELTENKKIFNHIFNKLSEIIKEIQIISQNQAIYNERQDQFFSRIIKIEDELKNIKEENILPMKSKITILGISLKRQWTIIGFIVAILIGVITATSKFDIQKKFSINEIKNKSIKGLIK